MAGNFVHVVIAIYKETFSKLIFVKQVVSRFWISVLFTMVMVLVLSFVILFWDQPSNNID